MASDCVGHNAADRSRALAQQPDGARACARDTLAAGPHPQCPNGTCASSCAPKLVLPHRTILHERNPTPYTRLEFLSARTEPVISALKLFAAWLDEDAGVIRDLLFGLNTAPLTEKELQHGLRPPPSTPPHRAQPDDADSRGAEKPRPPALPTPTGLNRGSMTPRASPIRRWQDHALCSRRIHAQGE